MRRITLIAMLVGLLGTVVVTPGSATALGSEGKIAFVRANQIYTMTKAGGTVRQLTTVGKNYRPKWSPDGKKIAYIQEDAAGKKNVLMMTATGTNKTKVTSSGLVGTAPVWSPDGKTLAFAQGQVIHLVKATAPFGTPYELLTYLSYESPGDAGPTGNFFSALAWSPNGQDLAYIGDSDDSPDYGIRTVHGMTTITPGAIHAEDIGIYTGGDCCGYEDWSDFNYIPNGVFGYATVDHGNYGGDQPGIIKLVYPGFVSQQGDKAGAPSPSGAHMVFVRNASATNTTPNIWTSTIKGAQRKMIQANGYQPDWQPLP